MKPDWEDSYELPDELDLSKLKQVPNPFSQRFRDLNLVSLDADVKAVFPDSQAVNEALRLLIKAGREAQSHKEELSKAS